MSEWSAMRPLFESMIFDLGINEVARRTGFGVGTIYRLVNGEVGKPHPRTVRDVRVAVVAWQDSQTERSAR